MFDQWVEVAYRHNQTKTASRELINKMKLLPLDELIKAAAGDPTSKLAYVDGPEDKQWIDKYKGTPLFEQAVGLEKELLQIDMQENEEHAARRAEEKAEEPRTNFYDMRDALKLKQRMLDLELAISQEGGGGAEATPAVSVEQIAPPAAAVGQAPAQPTEPVTAPKVAGLNPKAHVMRFYTDPDYRAACEKTAGSATGTFLPETRSTGKTPTDDRVQGAGAGNYTPEPSETVTGNIQVDKTAAAADTLKRYGQLVTGNKAKELGQTAKGWTRAARLTEGRPIHDLAARAAERVGSMAKSERLKSLGTQAATAAGAGAAAAGVHHAVQREKTATPYDDYTKTELAQRHHERKAKSEETHPTRTRILGALGEGARLGIPLGLGSAGAAALLTRDPRFAAEQGLKGLAVGGGLGALTGAMRTPGAYDRSMSEIYRDVLSPESIQQDANFTRELGEHVNKHPTQIRVARGVGLGAAGALGGRLIGKHFGHPDLGTAIGAGAGGLLGALPKPSGKKHMEDAAEIEKYMQTRGMQPGAEKQANVLFTTAREHKALKKAAALTPTDERAAVHKAIAEKHPGLVSKHLPPKIAGIGDVVSAGKNLATSAFKGGGIGQVAKSFGNVAGGLAKAHPLATAGLAAGGGLLAGKMLSRPQQPKLAAVNLRGVAKGARQLPLG